MTDYDGDRLLGRGREGSAGELQLPGHHPRRRLGVGSPLLCAEAMVDERHAQRAVDSLQAVVLGPAPGTSSDGTGAHSPAQNRTCIGAVGKILSSSTLSTSREQIVQRRFSGAVILRLLSVGPAGRSPHSRAALRAPRVLSAAGVRKGCVSRRAIQLGDRAGWDAERLGERPRG